MRLACTADLHLDRPVGPPRVLPNGQYVTWAESNAVLGEFFWRGNEEGVDGYVLAGDIFHGAHPHPEVQEILADHLRRAQRPVWLIPGNHELQRLLVGQRSCLQRYQDIPGVHVIGVRPVIEEFGDLQMVCVPWPLGWALRTASEPAVLSRALAEQLDRLAERVDPDRPSLAFMHVDAIQRPEVAPVVTPGQLDGWPWSHSVLGHIHLRQAVGSKAHYVGAPNRFEFSDELRQPSFSIVTEAGEVQEVPLDRARVLRTLTGPPSTWELEPNVYYKAELSPDGDMTEVRKAIRTAGGVLCQMAQNAEAILNRANSRDAAGAGLEGPTEDQLAVLRAAIEDPVGYTRQWITEQAGDSTPARLGPELEAVFNLAEGNGRSR